ncbi:acetyl-CoA carboxylase biotin carboxylase subunit [Candidatus Auribacterota bacterium]
MFEKILVANRGEIALRIIRACKELGISTVAVFSEADKESLHVKYADEAICIGPSPAAESYLNIPRIISAAEIADVEAIHPGYGFMAENAHFAEICQSCNIKFIGPNPESMRQMGDKNTARAIAKKCGVPVVPGSDGLVEDREKALKIAKKLGYPVIIKATAGGGGKGMRVAHNDISLANAFYTAKTEAEAAFKNSGVYIEKCIEKPRHIEFQILADSRGNVIHLGERDCTIQRRHQKLIEESPSPVLSPKLRSKMGKMAVKIAECSEYVNAGTIEFLLDKDNNFYFIEMNARIQVEHPVTEMVTGIDLIVEQIRIACGEKLKVEQKDVVFEGSAIECRVNAEDPDKNFMSSPGVVKNLVLPGGPGVRLDTHVYDGYTISPYYDSMVAKLIAYGKTRHDAICRMERALGEFHVEGIKTTIPFLRSIHADPDFRKGHYATDFVENILSSKD